MSDPNAKLEAFLNIHFAQCIEKVERLQGGMINFTFRIYLKKELPSVLSNKLNDQNTLASIHQWKPKTLIAKIAYPYIAVLGESFEFPIIRQLIEERALKLFKKSALSNDDSQPKSVDLSSVLHRNKAIQTPRVWLRDDINNVLVMDDHRALQTMDEWFSSKNSSLSNELSIAAAQAYGEKLGNFVVDIQVSSLPHIDQLQSWLCDPNFKQKDMELSISMIQKLCDTYNIPDVNELTSSFMRYHEHNISRAPTGGEVLAHGDLWAPNFLINESEPTLVVIDWEVAGVRSPALDPALLLARCRVSSINDSLNEHIVAFTNGFMDAYRESAKKNDVTWYKNVHEQYVFAWCFAIIYGTTVMYWSEFQTCCPDQNGVCDHRRHIAEIGADYLRQSRQGPDKSTYDFMLRDQGLSRLFQAPK